jgi:hypothetical protein
VQVSRIPNERAIRRSRKSVITALPERPAAPSDRSTRHALMRAGKAYHVNWAVDVGRSAGVRVRASNAEISGVAPFLATTGHRYHVSAVLIPRAGQGSFTLQLFAPETGRRGASVTLAFIAR